MTSALKTPWGRFPLPLPGGVRVTFHLIPSRCARTGATGVPAPEADPSSRPASGAGHFAGALPDGCAGYFTDEGDLVAVPPFRRVAGNRFSGSVATMRACVGAREGVPSDARLRAPP